ncbi:MAG: MBL fold metallo-hydrolase [Yoonia sp.]|uniref:MBL fold metallo-hydrolase n=1 Tax=Yoonia sp. TaxID=2212373 RepID=UPI003EF113BD
MTADFKPRSGHPHPLAPDLSLVLAPNPSPMTHLGTNSFLLGRDSLAIIDPGPDDPAHLDALCRAIDGRPVTHVFVTHSHLDHSPLARGLSDLTNAPIYAFGDSTAGRSDIMHALARAGFAGGGEGIDHSFRPDVELEDGALVTGPWGEVTAIHTPGHLGNHLCFGWGHAVFTGDHVMGWASSLVSPPDGDVTDFMQSCEKLAARNADIYYPAHGAPISDPAARMEWLLSHRKGRETQILQALRDGPATPEHLTQTLYHDADTRLLPAAMRNVFAHLIDLHQRGEITTPEALTPAAVFYLSKPE